jgi:6,7-dimethyl-8-ribityllumazine synthase
MRVGKQGNFKPFNASAYRVAIVAAQFNRDVTGAMLRRALAQLRRYRVPKKNIQVLRVPGCVEVAAALHAVAASERYDCAIAIGAIIRGETDHYYYVADIVCRSVSEAMEEGLPVGFAVLTTDTMAQAKARLDAGSQAAAAALHTARLTRRLRSKKL